jgi:lysophospholipase L1-like esterase
MEGTNDATFQSARARFDPGAIVGNLRTMVQLVKASGSIPILGAIPPNFRPSGVQFADGARSIIAAVNAMLPGVADQEGIRFVDVFGALNDPALFGPPDPLHPNQPGYDRARRRLAARRGPGAGRLARLAGAGVPAPSTPTLWRAGSGASFRGST